MTDIRYIIPRVIRHFLPENIVRFLMSRSWIIRPGLETRLPFEAADRYQNILLANNLGVENQRVLIFGYGGNFSVGCRLLELGASHVILAERTGFQQSTNRALLTRYGRFLEEKNGQVLPRPEFFTLIHGDIRLIAARGQIAPVDIVLSSSVFEHLDDVPGITRALGLLTRGRGVQLHFIDLRDHFFKYPFEMLCYTEETWKNWLNPNSNHNRYRLWDYSRTFDQFFESVDVFVLAREQEAFEKARPRIKAEFLSGDPMQDAATFIQVIVKYPCTAGEDS